MDRTRSLRVGIFFNARRDQGGLYQYALTLVHCLRHFGSRHQYTLFHATLEPLPATLDGARWEIVTLPRRKQAPRLALELALMSLARRGLRRPLRIIPPYPEIATRPMDLMLYVKPTLHSFLWPYQAVFPIHDLQHLLQPHFPEVSAGGERARREFLYRNAVPRAAAILTDSEVGREDVLQAYNPDPSRVYPLPYLAPTYLRRDLTAADLARVRRRYQLPPIFLFYPSAFWPHKNHRNLITALSLLQRADVHLVLAGSPNHEYEKLEAHSRQLGLAERVHFLGYVPDQDVYPLYRLAAALVMPTFFGPTNIPVLEAWSLGCPVISSDIRGIRQQVGDAGLLADPNDPRAIAAAIDRLLGDEELRQQVIQRGRERVAQWTPAHFAHRLEDILTHAAAIQEGQRGD